MSERSLGAHTAVAQRQKDFMSRLVGVFAAPMDRSVSSSASAERGFSNPGFSLKNNHSYWNLELQRPPNSPEFGYANKETWEESVTKTLWLFTISELAMLLGSHAKTACMSSNAMPSKSEGSGVS